MNNTLHKRLGYELLFLTDEYKNIIVNKENIVINNDNDNDKIISIQYNFTDDLYIKILLTNDYPFKAPIIYINHYLYKKYIHIFKKNINEIIYFLNIPCPCCITITEQHNWSPSNTINNIIDEYIKNCKLFHNLYKINYVKKYLIKTYPTKEFNTIISNIYYYLD